MSTTQTDPQIMDAIADQNLDDAIGRDAPKAKKRGRPAKAATPPPAFNLTNDQLMQLLSALTTARDNTAANAVSPELTDAIGGISELAKQVARQADETARTVRKSNAIGTHPGVSAFSYPEGDMARPKPDLLYKSIVAGQKVSKDELTPVEIELLNKFTTSKEARNGTWKAVVKQNGSTSELHIIFPCRTIDDLAGLPSLVQILTELHYGADATDGNAMAARMIALEQKLAAFEAAATKPSEAVA